MSHPAFLTQISNQTKVNSTGSHQAASSAPDIPALMAESTCPLGKADREDKGTVSPQVRVCWSPGSRVEPPSAVDSRVEPPSAADSCVEPPSTADSRVEPPSAVDSRRGMSNTACEWFQPTSVIRLYSCLPHHITQPSQTLPRHLWASAQAWPLIRNAFSSPPGSPHSPARLSLSGHSLLRAPSMTLGPVFHASTDCSVLCLVVYVSASLARL